MDRKKLDETKLQVLERRNYFREVDAPLKFSKRSLYNGMQERVYRQEERIYSKELVKQKKLNKGNLVKVNKYLSDLDAYNIKQ